jgi:hypothetical protein
MTTMAVKANSATTLYHQYTYFDTGTLKTASGVSTSASATCTTNPALCTTYNYSATNNSSCGNSFVTSVSEPLGLSRSTAWDCTGGVSTQYADENGQSVITAFSDPAFWRAAAVTDQASNQALISYIGQNASESALSFNSGSSLSDKRNTVDGFGRPILQQRLQAPSAINYDTVESDYNSLGQISRITKSFSAGAGIASTSAPATLKTYDGLGRVLTLVAADGGKVSYTYTNNDALEQVSGSQIFQKQFEYDGLGRLTSVCEITTAVGSGLCNQSNGKTGFWTVYTYDAIGNLTGVTQNAQAASGSRQARLFSVDLLSRMISEQNPETGSITYIYDSSDSSCGSYVSTGDLVEKKDAAGNVSCLQYDLLHRKTHVTYPLGPNAALTAAKTFVYDTSPFTCPAAPGIAGNVAGRLAEAYAGSSTSKITDIGFCYSSRGEVTDLFESTPHSAGVYHTMAAYNPTGGLQSLSGIPGIPTTTYGADGEGRLSTAQQGTTKIVCDSSCSVASTTYNVAGQPLTVQIGGVSDNDAYTYDSNTGKMKTFKFTAGAVPLTFQGTLNWNTNGTLQSLGIADGFNSSDTQTCNYLYDDLGRVGTPPGSSALSVNCGTVWQQTFTYDAFGNLTKSGSITWNPGYTLKNQYTLAGTSYDLNGDLLNDTFHTYKWDADGHVVSIDSATCGTNGTCLTYDALGEMLEKNVSGAFTEILYSPVGKTGVMSGQSVTNAYLPLPGGATLSQTPSGARHFYHKDWGWARFGLLPDLQTEHWFLTGLLLPSGKSMPTLVAPRK